MRWYLMLLFLMLFSPSLSGNGAGQQAYVKGTVCDSLTLSPIPGAVIELLDRDSTSLRYQTTGQYGEFLFNNTGAPRYLLRCTMLGYRTRVIGVSETDMGVITMAEDIRMLEAAVAEEQAIRTSQNGDTLVYNAAAYKVMMGSSSEDLIAKMPGVSVDSRSVEANGRKVTRIMVDGKEYFSDDVMTALRNVPADLISEIEVVNKVSDESELTQIDDGDNTAAINIVTKKAKTGGKGDMVSGRFYGGYGIPDKYIGGGSANWFGREQSATVLAMANNISRYNFVSDDLVSASSSDANTAGKDFSVQPLAGLSAVQSAGGNYTNPWFSGSYLFNRIDNENYTENLTRRRTSDDFIQISDSETDFEALNMTHRFSAKMNFRKGSHSVIFRPFFSYQDLDDCRTQRMEVSREYPESPPVFVHNRVNDRSGDRRALRTGGRLAYSYRFSRPGRSLTTTVYGGYSRNAGEEHSSTATITDAEAGFDEDRAKYKSGQYRDRLAEGYNVGANLTYTEPLSRKSRLAVDYKFGLTENSADNMTRLTGREPGQTEPDPRQSASNESRFLTNTLGVRYNFRLRKTSLTANLAYQHVDFRGESRLPYADLSERRFNDAVYSLIANIPFNPENHLRVDAKGWTQNPGVQMMQDVVNLNNTSFVRAGNPDIMPSYLHRVNVRYVHTDRAKGSTVSLSADFSGSANFIGDSLVVDSPDFEVAEGILLGEGNQFSKPINIGGYYKVGARLTYGFPVKFLSSNLNLNANASWSSVPGMINAERVPVRRDRYGILMRLDSNFSENLDFTLGYDAGYVSNEYSNAYGKVRNNFFLQNARLRLKWVIWKGITFSTSCHYQQNLSTDRRYNDHSVFWDVFLGKRLFRNRRGEISIGCNDIFDHTSKVYRHSISASGTSDVSNIGVGRYFSIQFVYHLRKM